MIIAQMLMGVLIVAIVFTFGRQLLEDIQPVIADLKRRWLFNVEELSFCKHIWSRRPVYVNDREDTWYVDKIICINQANNGRVCGREKGAQS